MAHLATETADSAAKATARPRAARSACRFRFRTLWQAVWLVLLVPYVACSASETRDNGYAPGTGGSGQNTGGSAAGTGGDGGNGGSILVDGSTGDAPTGDCRNLECRQTTCTRGACTEKACDPGVLTTVTGTVYDPAGKVPLYNVVVYVPNSEVKPFTAGVSCDRCNSAILNPVASALTDTHGKFVLEDVPVGANIPLVIQVGKWRRQIVIPNVPRCVETALTNVDETRLPKNKSEGDIPLIAITTGGADSIECLPRRMGIEDSEFTTSTGNGRIHLFAGATDGSDQPAPNFAASHLAGAPLTSATTLWNDLEMLKKYDLVILSCEGGLADGVKPPAARQAMYDYASLGGRVLATHWQHIWFSGGPSPVPTVASPPWLDRDDPPDSNVVGTINQSFPKGKALAEWLVNVGSQDGAGQIVIADARDNLQGVDATHATEWITIQNSNAQTPPPPTAVEYMTFNTPIGVPEEQQCGRAVFTDLHVGAASGDSSGARFPSGCEEADLSTQEKVVEFMLFDLSSCIQNDDDPPEPPPIPR